MASAASAVAVTSARELLLWRIARYCGLALTAALLAGLWWQAEMTLRVLWYAVIPVLPAVFLVHPALWRNVCPLATLNTLPNRIPARRVPSPALTQSATVLGFALFALLVPARRFLFNMDGPALALVIVAVALLAFATGFVFDRKAGFCNTICPVLPVEKLYGQSPLTTVSNPHCATCTACTPGGCLDLAPRKVVPIATRNGSRPWFFTPYGAFAAAFPGFVLGWSLLSDGTIADAPRIYVTIIAFAAASHVVVSAISAVTRVGARTAVPVIGGATLVLYYWFAASSIGSQWQLGTGAVHAIRGLAVLLVGYWLVVRR